MKIENLESKEYIALENEVIIDSQFKKNNSFSKKPLTKIETSSLFIFAAIFLFIFSVAEFFLPIFVGIFIAWQAILIFFKKEKALGLLLFFIGTPVAVVISYYISIAFFYLISIIILVLMILFLFFKFFKAIKTKKPELFFQKNWLNLIIFSLLLWLFFLAY